MFWSRKLSDIPGSFSSAEVCTWITCPCWGCCSLLWAVRGGELSLQLDPRVCCAGLTLLPVSLGLRGKRWIWGTAATPTFSHPVPELFPEGAGISADQWDWLSGHLVDAGVKMV